MSQSEYQELKSHVVITPDDIVIMKAESREGGSGGEPLVGCYFAPIPGSQDYSFHDQTGKVLNPEVENRKQFKTQIGGIKFHITSDFEHTHDPVGAKAKGFWKIPGPGDGDDEDSGTFHAQAGGGGSVATATA